MALIELKHKAEQTSASAYLIERSIIYTPIDSQIYFLDNENVPSIRETLKLTPRLNQFLCLLVYNYPKHCSNEYIIQQIWSGHSSPEGVTQLVNKLRKTLGDKEKKIIVNTHKQGYSISKASAFDSYDNALSSQLKTSANTAETMDDEVEEISFSKTPEQGGKLTSNANSINPTWLQKTRRYLVLFFLAIISIKLALTLYDAYQFKTFSAPPYNFITEEENNNVSIILPNGFTCRVNRDTHEAKCKN